MTAADAQLCLRKGWRFMNLPTPHISAQKGDFAKTVLMPGDPLRAKFVAENYLENPILVNSVRGINGYTGTYQGKRVSVMASGMGMPSMGIYSYELFAGYDVDNIIRIGTAGALRDDLRLRDMVFGMGACTNSGYAAQYQLPGTFAPIASFELLRKAVEAAEKMEDIHYMVGNLLSSDTFYSDSNLDINWRKMGVLAVEMEAAALYMNAARTGKQALAICTISDSIVTGETTDSSERQSSFQDMMRLALEIA